jgi:hypothetical protein
MIKNYKVIALYSSDDGNQRESVFSENVGLFYSEMSAQEAIENFEEHENAPNFLGCSIKYMSEVLE